MSNLKQKLCSKDEAGEDEDLFDESSLLAHFENTSFKDKPNFSRSVINESLNNSNNSLNVSALCCDEEISGYDRLTGKTWIYPTNYPVRDYQFNIIRAALLKNTLVSLPTGLGKTFIAAVVMYNFYRWYPLGKIVFTAPTRPLVAQQIEACYDIIAIPPKDTVEMTGHMQVNTRKTHWQTKRVFFATPQVIYNDIKSGICPGEKIRCLVVDEAHRARGNYAYCQIVATLAEMKHRTYRLLALSATPGSKVDDVINVVKHLNIAHLELRSESCIDVAPYSHARRVATVVVPLGPELTQLRTHYIEILDGYARRLKQMNILPHNLGNLSKGRVVMLYKEFQSKERGSRFILCNPMEYNRDVDCQVNSVTFQEVSKRHPQHNYIMKDFTLLIALYHGLELLLKHGSRVFLNFFDEHPEKAWVQADDRLTALLERLRDDLGVNPMALDRSMLPDGTIPDLPNDLCFGHPKFDKLKEIMLKHFNSAKRKAQNTKAIVFCEYRESVNLVHCLLLQCRPLIMPQMFVGQGASGKDGKTVVSQKQQLRVMRQFREGACNALVATCVAEEGLDVGAVDLILCFDISTSSPVRLVQRCGRTGRERGGQVFILVTEGREHQTLMDCMRQRDGLNAKILHSKEVANNLYKANPRMMPHDFTPVCQKMFITVAQKEDPKNKKDDDKSKKNQKDLRSMLGGGSGTSKSASTIIGGNGIITETEFNEMFPNGYESTSRLAEAKEYLSMDKDTFKSQLNTGDQVNLSTWLEWQRNPQKTVKIGHSKDTEILASLLQYSDAKRFDLPPSTQNPTFNTQHLATQEFVVPAPEMKPKKKQKAQVSKSPTKKCGDIRALFSTATKSTKSYTKLINDLGIKDDGSIPTSVINLLVDLSIDNTSVRTCYICQNICECAFFDSFEKHRRKLPKPLLLTNLNLPDINLIDDLDIGSILMCGKKANNSQDMFEDFEDSTCVEAVKGNCSNFDLEFDFGSPDEIVSPEDNKQVVETDANLDENFDLGVIEDLFVDSSPEEGIIKEASGEAKNSSNPKEALGFFGLDSIEDIFIDSDESKIEPTPKNEEKIVKNDNNNHCIKENQLRVEEKEFDIGCPGSPSILSGQIKTKSQPKSPTSPILCSQVRKFQLTTKRSQLKSSTPISNAKRQLITESSSTSKDMVTDNNNTKVSITPTLNRDSVLDSTNKSMYTITQLVEMINKTDKTLPHINVSKAVESPAVQQNKERSTSPILLTQAVRKKNANLNTSIKSNNSVSGDKRVESLIVLDSDSDSNELTQVYEVEDLNPDENLLQSKVEQPLRSSSNHKRKFESDDESDFLDLSPYFGKKPKMDDKDKPVTLQEKVLAALNRSHKPSDKNNDSSINFMISLQKENRDPTLEENKLSQKSNEDEIDKYVNRKNLEMLQMFRRDSQVRNPKQLFQRSTAGRATPQKRKSIALDDSDDDFVDDGRRSQKVTNNNKHKSTTNHKVRKKAKNSFLDLEAEESDDACGSGDELSDGSAGSVADFICDDEPDGEPGDVRAHYLRAVTGTVHGAFKIPELPSKFRREEVLSQFVEEDSYEMDSFCVDSHIGLTQVNDVTELELAEIILEERKAKRKCKPRALVENPSNDNSPLVIRRKRSKMQIQSDSDDSS